jgi:hypothetical protein
MPDEERCPCARTQCSNEAVDKLFWMMGGLYYSEADPQGDEREWILSVGRHGAGPLSIHRLARRLAAICGVGLDSRRAHERLAAQMTTKNDPLAALAVHSIMPPSVPLLSPFSAAPFLRFLSQPYFWPLDLLSNPSYQIHGPVQPYLRA